MKRLIALMLLTVSILVLVGCDGIIEDDLPKLPQTKIDTKKISELIAIPSEIDLKGDYSTTFSVAAKNGKMEKVSDNFTNDTVTYKNDAVTIRPKHVYWDNGSLVAECFVINGFSCSVSDFIIKSLSFSNDDGQIATSEFDTVEIETIVFEVCNTGNM